MAETLTPPKVPSSIAVSFQKAVLERGFALAASGAIARFVFHRRAAVVEVRDARGLTYRAAASVDARYYLPYRAAVHGEFRYFTDTWGIDSMTAQIGYTHPWRDRWIFEAGYRWYDQTAADFYSDLFPYADAGLFAFELKTGDRAALADHLRLFGIGYSWGGYESLAMVADPYRTVSAPPASRLVRLHIGLEDADDLIADLASALRASR